MIDELEMRLLHEADHPACNRDIWPEDLLREAAADIVVKKAAIAESARMIHKLMTRALAAEARLAEFKAEAKKVIEPLAILAEDSAATLSKNNSDLAPSLHSLARRARSFLDAKETA